MNIEVVKGTDNKALIVTKEGIDTLVSYDTDVAEYNRNNGKMSVSGWYSNTTMKHLNKFFKIKGFSELTKQKLIETYNLKH